MVTTITPTIVTLNTVVTFAPQPSQLQQSAAIVSCGGSTLNTGTFQYCGNLAQAQSILASPGTITSMVYSSGTVTATVGTLHLAAGQNFLTTISSVVPTGYDGTFEAVVNTGSTFSYLLSSNPGTVTTQGTYTVPYSAFIDEAATTFFAQGSAIGVYVLELGVENTATAAISALGTYIANNSGNFYSYLVDSSWDGTAMATLANTYANPNSQTYFFVTTGTATISDYAGIKSVYATVPAPSAPTTEITSAAMLYQWTQQQPSASAPARPMQFRQLFGVTAWPTTGQNTAIDNILTASGNIVYSGVEGGLPTNNYIFRGTTMDGNQSMFWYSVDWFQIQAKLQMANAVINGSNSLYPIVYNQQGINALATVGQHVGNSWISFGLGLEFTLTATPFNTYVTQNPANYAAGIYGGFAATVVPQLGFQSITFNIDATTFA